MAEKLFCWPRWMPLAQSNGYSYEPTDRRTKTDMEVGSVLRVNFDTDETTLDCSLILNVVQSQWFEVFERNLIRQGATWFEMPIQVAGCIEWHTVRFASQPKASWKGPIHTTYSFKLDIQKRNLDICPELAEFLLCFTPEELLEIHANVRYAYVNLKTLQKPTWIVDAVKDAA